MKLNRLSLMALGAVALAQPQTPPARTGFEVASVKPAANPEGRALVQALQGRLTMTNLSLRRLILIAYCVQDYQLLGDPPWAASEHYDVQAKADGNPSVQQLEGPMLRALLEDRFKMVVHRETRQLPVYELTVASGGAKLQHTKEGSCVHYAVDAPPPPPTAGQAPPNYCGFKGSADGLNRTLEGRGISMQALAASLSRTYNSVLGRNVIDVTGLAGLFDIHLTWTIDDLSGAAHPGAALPADTTGPPIVTALQEQLGLKLRTGKGPVEVLVMDHIEKPSAN